MTCKQPRVATETNIQIVLLMVRIILMLNVCKRVLPCRGITEFTSATKPSLQEHSPYLNQLCIAMFQTKPFIISLANHNHAEFHCFSCFFLAALHTLVTSRDTSHVCSVKYWFFPGKLKSYSATDFALCICPSLVYTSVDSYHCGLKSASSFPGSFSYPDTISHEGRLLPQCLFANDVIIKGVYRSVIGLF